MRAFVIDAPGRASVVDVPAPVAGAGQVVVDVERAGVCGTDVEFYTGDMAYLHDGNAAYPVRIGHEWCGTVASVGPGVEGSWLGRRVTGDTMLGCGRCVRCRSDRQHVCEHRMEIGIRGGWAGALAEQVLVPVSALHCLPEQLDVVAGALVEPGGNALRAVQAAQLSPGVRVLIWGPGSIGLLAAGFAAATGAEVHLAGTEPASLSFARSLGYRSSWDAAQLPDVPFDAMIDATYGADVPRAALELVEPGGRLVLIGIAGRPSPIDTRELVLKDVTAVGILSASPGLAEAIAQYASGAVDPRPLVAATVGLDDVEGVLAGRRPPGAGAGPKVHVDPGQRTR
uniref:Threonine dehydrogenase and related Zn-dependent dehydrogenases n=1 Tax=uncultured Nocardioidaceae bacterium TaxID=253824 RepID=A0A6J4KXT5_9ACTN|nr:MAG: Threonine dehydrogenase and related Zn-dependent dehydrogenases [uncultured Nocardioidaceae bacterium]